MIRISLLSWTSDSLQWHLGMHKAWALPLARGFDEQVVGAAVEPLWRIQPFNRCWLTPLTRVRPLLLCASLATISVLNRLLDAFAGRRA